MSSSQISATETRSRKTMGLRTMLMAFTLIAITVTAIIVAVSIGAAHRSERAATQTFVAKDVTADILPPPLYLIELRLVLSQGAEGTLAPDEVKADVDRLKGEYLARIQFWKDNPPHGLETKLLGAQHEAGLAFLGAADKVVDALESKADSTEVLSALQSAHSAYLKHREGVDATVKESVAFA